MTPDRLQELLDAFGADPTRWPREECDAALELIARSPAAQAQVTRAAALDTALNQWADPPLPRFDAPALTARVAATPQRSVVVRAPRRWPVFVWPNVMGLAAAALAGFLIGWSGLDTALLPTNSNGVEMSSVATVIEDATW
ncbi:MAG: hypothetical protein U1E25_14160 [Methylocystis sp.]